MKLDQQQRLHGLKALTEALAAKPDGFTKESFGKEFAENLIAGATRIAEFIYFGDSTEGEGEQPPE